MKKRISAIFLIICIALLFLASCGNKPSGVYYAGDKASGTYTKYDFDGSTITIESYLNGVKNESASLVGKYEIDDNQITIHYEDENGSEKTISKAFEMVYEDSNDTIKIGVLICHRES